MAKRLKTGVGHDGRMNAIARPGEAIHDVHHTPALARNQEAQQHTNATLGKPGKPKGYAVSLHNGMTEQQRKMTGMGHPMAGAPDAASANPLDPTVPGKRLTPVQPVPGMRSRSNDSLGGSKPGENHMRGKPDVDAMRSLGAAVLAEALCNK
ncbi:MAG TPA: hypothetical protein VL048_05890 [Xanthobacteraceae bacterium]|nr:hypothetical protein [Xanthobacteraceae bacterium]